jgi:acetolactate synthase I/III small subunit
MTEKHTLLITVANRVAVLARIAGLLSSRGYNIESIIGWRTEDPDIYQIHLVTYGTAEQIEQISKQIQKLIDTIKVVNISHKKGYLIYEFALVKVQARKGRSEILDLVNVFGAKVADITEAFVTIDLSGPTQKIDRFLELMKPFGIREYIRSGHIAVSA